MQADLVADVPRFSLTERDERWARVRSLMREEELDAIFVPPNTGLWDQFQANVRYLTGIGGNCSQAAAVFPLEGEVTAITSPDVDMRYWKARQDWVNDIRPITAAWGYAGAGIERLKELGLEEGRIGVTGLAGNTRFPEGITSFGIVNHLREAFPKAELVNSNLLMDRARYVKSEEELDFMKQATGLVEQALEVLYREARPGVPENVAYARMVSAMIEGGGELPTMILWSAGWPQPPSNHYVPSRRKFHTGDMVCVEAEARWGGYIAQNTQPLFVGKAPAVYHEMFELQQEVLAATYENLRPGKTIGDLVQLASGFSNDHYHCYMAIHARGLGDDSPMAIFAARDEVMRDWPISENATFIVKPLITTPDRATRIYWGDTIFVSPDGAKRLGSRKPELVELT